MGFIELAQDSVQRWALLGDWKREKWGFDSRQDKKIFHLPGYRDWLGQA
jgi:hypothetical protein